VDSDLRPLNLQVIATTPDDTRTALAEARQLSATLKPARIVLLIPKVVSDGGAADGPIENTLLTEEYRDMVEEAGVDATVRLCLCRRYAEAFRWMVATSSVIVIAGRRRWWWPTFAQRIARQLQNQGHRVVFADASRAIGARDRLR
jgi:hypothetical protein